MSIIKQAGDLIEFMAKETGLLDEAKALAEKVAAMENHSDQNVPISRNPHLPSVTK